jgi:hypothetical protein
MKRQEYARKEGRREVYETYNRRKKLFCPWVHALEVTQ